MYGKGIELEKDYFQMKEGQKIFFYDKDSIKEEFQNYGLEEILLIDEPHKNEKNDIPFNFIIIKCKKLN